MTIKEIDEQIAKLRSQRLELEKVENEQRKAQARLNVGRCFKINGSTYARVIDIPQDKWEDGYHIGINWYQYPAVFIGKQHDQEEDEDPIPFYYGTLFSGAWGEGNDILNKYAEITPEVFAAVFEQKLAELKEKIGV